MAAPWLDDAVSINVNLTLSVVGGDPEVAGVVEGVLRKHGVDGDVRLTYADGTLAGDTPYPLIISRFGAWSEEFEADLRAAVATVARSAVVDLAWRFPDEP